MTLKSFEKIVFDYMTEAFGKGRVDLRDVKKNNGITLRGITVMFEDVSACPTLYVDDMYDSYLAGKDIDSILSEYENVFRKARLTREPDLSCLENPQWIKENVYIKLVNRERNEELLKDVPYIDYLDLAIVFFVMLEIDGNGFGTILIQNGMLKNLCTNVFELYDAAMENNKNKLKHNIVPIEELLLNMMEGQWSQEAECIREDIEKRHSSESEFPMYVLSNQHSRFGASAMLDTKLLKDFSKKINSDFYILPSSIHELILIPVNMADDAIVLRDMVEEVNRTQLAPGEILSDNVYIFNRKTGKVINL